MLHDHIARRRCASKLQGILSRSVRTSEIVQLLSAGNSEAVIAERVGIAVCTVHAHVQDMYGDLGIGDRLMLGIAIADAFPSPALETSASPSGSSLSGESVAARSPSTR